jgi:hypothetical protein
VLVDEVETEPEPLTLPDAEALAVAPLGPLETDARFTPWPVWLADAVAWPSGVDRLMSWSTLVVALFPNHSQNGRSSAAAGDIASSSAERMKIGFMILVFPFSV